MSGEVRVKGLSDLNALLQELPAKMERNVLRGALRAGARVVQAEAKANVPVDTGALRAGIKVSTGGKRGAAGVVIAKVRVTGRHAFVAPWLEYGVAAHTITARRGGWLFFGAFARSVEHPGFAPRPFMRPALDSKAQAAVVAAGNYIKQRLATKHGLDTADIEVEAA